MAAATSQEAMMAYWGLVDMCMRKASLNTSRSSLRVSLSCTRIWDAWDSPASSLWVDWVEKIMESRQGARPSPMA